MRTLDRNYLATHPAGDEKADLTLSVNVPASVTVADNPDGTRPKITLHATGDTYMDVLHGLTTIHDDGDSSILSSLLQDVITDDEMAAYESLEEAAPLLKERSREIVTPFRTFSFGYLVSGDEGATDRDVDFTLKTPQIAAGVKALHVLTKPNSLTKIAVDLCPVTDDDEDECSGNDVLVMNS